MKRKFQLAGGILSIIVGSLSSLGAFLTMAALSLLSSMEMPEMGGVSGILWFSTLLVLGLGITIIVFGSILCKNKKSHGVAITLVVLTGIIALFQMIGTTDGNLFSILIILLQLTTLAMLITYLVAKEEVDTIVTSSNQSQAPKPAPAPAPENKIELLISLRDNGTITEEEFKSLLKKELEK